MVGLSGLPAAHRPITDVLAEVLAVLLLVLGWRFRRGRLVVAAVALALANFLVRGPLADASSEAGLAALAISRVRFARSSSVLAISGTRA